MLSRFTPFVSLAASPWPLVLRFRVFNLTLSVVLWFQFKLSLSLLLINLVILTLSIFIWWKDVIREGLLGVHTGKLVLNFRGGFLLFILSEVFFFVSFFWAFYDSSLAPSIELGMVWPPVGILPLEVYSVPLLNTIILLSRGVTVTWAHHSLINNLFFESLFSLLFTVLFGVYFLYMQFVEYCEGAFSISDGVYGSTFYLATGFHGFHVIVGTVFLFYVFTLLVRGRLTFCHHFSFESAAWYWHFVDVVWLFLYIRIYWWGSL